MISSTLSHLSQLLPYELEQKKHGSLKTGLKEYQVITLALVKASQALEEGTLENFDGLVGENACQIRAIWIAIIFSIKQIDYCSLKEKSIKVLNKIDLLINSKTINSLIRSEETLKDVLKKEDLDICLTPEELYILYAFILTKLKTVVTDEKEMSSLCRIEKISPKKLSQFADVSHAFAHKLVHKLRTLLASASVQFIRDTANHLGDKTLMRMVSEDFIVQRNFLSSLPLYWTMKTVILVAQKEQIPLIIHVKFLRKGQTCYTVFDEDHLFFKFGSNGSYVSTKPNEVDLDKAAWVVQGVAAPNKEGKLLLKEQWTAYMAKRPITDVLLAGTADHRQYPDETKNSLIFNLKDEEYEHYRVLAKEEGFSLENPTTFFIQHIYAVRIGNMLGKSPFQFALTKESKPPSVALPVSLNSSPSSLKSLQDNPSNNSHSFLSQLLPYDPVVKTEKRAQDGLNEYLVLLALAEQAMYAWQKGNFHLFDPLVGENACQIRAIKIASILRNSTVNPDRILKEIQHSKTLIHELQASHLSNTSLERLLKDTKIDIQMTCDEQFLILSFALTKTKVVRPFFKPDKPLVENAYTDSKKIKEIGQVGTYFSDELVKKLRKTLSADSVRYVQELAIHLNPSEIKLLSDQFLYMHHGLKCLPYYWTTRALMNYAQKENIPIILIAQQIAKDQGYKLVKTTQIYFRPTPTHYEKINPSLLDPAEPALVLVGTMCKNYSELPSLETWTNELLQHCPVDLVLAYAAAHRQYPDESKDSLLEEISDAQYEYHKAKAEEWGCSLQNPSLFFLTHAFCNNLKNVGISEALTDCPRT